MALVFGFQYHIGRDMYPYFELAIYVTVPKHLWKIFAFGLRLDALKPNNVIVSVCFAMGTTP